MGVLAGPRFGLYGKCADNSYPNSDQEYLGLSRECGVCVDGEWLGFNMPALKNCEWSLKKLSISK